MTAHFRMALAAAAIAMTPAHSFAWGEYGHSTVAEITQKRLTPVARGEVEKLLGGGSLAAASSWADDWRPSHPETYNWHFVDIPIAKSTYEPATECKDDPQKGDCLVAELDRLRNDLRCASTDDAKTQALRFAVHFVGDMGQPWHTVAEKRGGNDIKVTITYPGVRGSKPVDTNIHSAWDQGLLERSAWNWGAVEARIEDGWLKSTAAMAPDVATGTPTEWAVTTHTVAQKVYAMTPANGELDKTYFDAALPIIDQQLGLSGLRLARFLNDAYASAECPVK